MNQKATYEITITEKLEQLNAPGMVETIWARIEAQLDIDLPTDDGPASPPAVPKSGPGKWVNRGFIIVSAAIVLVYLFNNRKQTPTTNNQPTINTPVSAPNNNDIPVQNNSPGTNKGITPKIKSPAPATSSAALPVDSNSIAPVAVPARLQPDSSVVNRNLPPLVNAPLVIPQKNTAPYSLKKGRGVKGITNADYKIVPQKDSSNE